MWQIECIWILLLIWGIYIGDHQKNILKSSSYEMCLDVPRHVIHAVYKQVNFYYLGFLCTRRIMTLVNVYVEENLITNLKISKRFKHIWLVLFKGLEQCQNKKKHQQNIISVG